MLAIVLAAAIAVAPSDGSQRVRADVDGDGRRDRISLTGHERFFVLQVDTGKRMVTKAVRGFSGATASADGRPSIVALRPLNRRRGLEIQVRTWRGAANDFLAFYALEGGRLVAMTGGPHASNQPPFVWTVGGTIGTGSSQADCVRPGQIAVVDQWHHRGIWHYRTTLYNVRRTRFVRAVVYELASERMVRSLPPDWPRVKRLEFESCGGIVAPRTP